MSGYVPASGSGDNGCLVVLEAAGADEEIAGVPTVGAAGQFLWNQLHRIGIEREGFRVHNVLSCRPPNNKLTGMFYEPSVIASCAPNLDATIASHVAHAKSLGKTPVIIALGKIAFRRLWGFKPKEQGGGPLVTDKDQIMKESYLAYPFWSNLYNSWIISTHHPSHLMQGKHHLIPILHYCFQRALEIADNGLQLDHLSYLEDPEPTTFESWIQDYFYTVDHNPDTFLSYDIETAYKQGKEEDEIVRAEDDGGILRVSFSYKPGHAVSIPWQADYLPLIGEIFSYSGAKVGWNNSQFDAPKIKEQLPINGDDIDAMLAWHVLNTSMPKGLGFVTPFYAKSFPMWKHMSKDRPAFYNAADADAALRCWLGIREDLKRNNLWNVFSRHVIDVHRVFSFMSSKGVLLDQEMRLAAEHKLSAMLAEIEQKIEENIPDAARKIDKVFKREPADKSGLLSRPGHSIEHYCTVCGLIQPGKQHFKRFVKKVNPCADGVRGSRTVPVVEWYRLRSWRASKDQLGNYQSAIGHKPIFDRRKGKVSYDESAMMKLIAKYPSDKIYPLILDHREKAKLLGTYIGVTQLDGRIKGGMPIGPDGRIHTQFTSNPSTLRSASQNPNLQNLPRPTDDLAAIIRNLIISSPGNILYARDFSGIEAVLTGYDAGAPGYMRLARRDVHTFYTAYALHSLDPGRVLANDLPLLSWDDAKLFARLSELKGHLKKERNSLYKHLVHAANFMQSASGAQKKIYAETGQDYPVSLVQQVMDIYFELFPEIKRWHYNVLLRAEKDGFLRNNYGYIHRFLHVFNYERIGTDSTGKVKWDKKPNPDVANKVIAFGPQSNAAGIIKEAMLQLYELHYELVGQFLRLLVHDELFFDCPEGTLDNLDRIVQTVMESPLENFRLPPSYNLGPYLSILTEAKKGYKWGSMR